MRPGSRKGRKQDDVWSKRRIGSVTFCGGWEGAWREDSEAGQGETVVTAGCGGCTANPWKAIPVVRAFDSNIAASVQVYLAQRSGGRAAEGCCGSDSDDAAVVELRCGISPGVSEDVKNKRRQQIEEMLRASPTIACSAIVWQ